MERIEVITGERRHRRWSLESKLRILSEASAPGIPAAAVARRHDLHPQQLYRWRRELGEPAGHREEIPAFVPVRVAGSEPRDLGDGVIAGCGAEACRIEVTLVNGRRLAVREDIAPQRLAVLARALEGR